MLSSWLAIIVTFAKAQWLPITTAMIALIIWESGRRKLKKSEAKLKEHAEDAFVILAKKDVFLIEAAKARVAPDAKSRKDFFDILGFRLDFLARKFRHAHELNKRLGLAALISSSISSFVTGSGLFGQATIGTSFLVTSCGSVALAVVTFSGAADESVSTLVLAERLRQEVAEYVGSADSYEGLSDDEAYYLFARTINTLFVDNITSQEASLKAKLAAQAATDTKDGEAA